MKKEWSMPVVEELNITETANGPEDTDSPDGLKYQNDHGGWSQDYGKKTHIS